MLVDNSFIIIQIPRCASTSFIKACIKNGIETRNIKSQGYPKMSEDGESGIHFHENILSLKKYFGSSYPIVAIKRNGAETFLSFWKHTIKMFKDSGYEDVSARMSSMDIDDIFFFKAEDYNLMEEEDLRKLGREFQEKIGFNSKEIPLNFFYQPFLPKQWFHRNDPDVIWFDFNNLSQLEEWVSLRIKKEFKLSKENSSIDIKCSLKLNSDLFEKYKSIYSEYEEFKNKKTLI